MKSRCEQALELVWVAGLTEAPDDAELAEARRHLAACPPCPAFLRRDSVLAARLRDLRLCGASPCPDDLRQAVCDKLWSEGTSEAENLDTGLGVIARIRNRSWPAWVEGAVAATAAALLITGGLALSDRLGGGLPDDVFVDDFRRTALPEIVRPNVPQQEVADFYRAQFGGDGPALVLDAPVTKVAVCNLEGRMGAFVEYDWSGERLVFYQVPRPEEGGRMTDFRTGAEGDVSVVRWVDARYDYALIGALPGEELARIARSART